MLKAICSPTTQVIYSGARAALTYYQRSSPEHQYLILRIQRAAMILDTLFVLSLCKKEYDDSKNTKSDGELSGMPLILALGAGATLAVVILTSLIKPPIDLKGLVKLSNPHISMDWTIPFVHKVMLWLLEARIFMNIGVNRGEPLCLLSVALDFYSLMNSYELTWIRVEKEVTAQLSNNEFKGRAAFDFFIPSCKNMEDHLPAAVQSIHDYVQNCFNSCLWQTFSSPTLLGKMFPRSVTAFIKSPSIPACIDKVAPILNRIGGKGTLNGKSIYFIVLDTLRTLTKGP